VETQELIASYERDGEPLFYPDSEAWRAAQEEMTEEPSESEGSEGTEASNDD
jgi:hypothetical protein